MQTCMDTNICYCLPRTLWEGITTSSNILGKTHVVVKLSCSLKCVYVCVCVCVCVHMCTCNLPTTCILEAGLYERDMNTYSPRFPYCSNDLFC